MGQPRRRLIIGIVGLLGMLGGNLDRATAQPPRPVPGAQPDLVPVDLGVSTQAKDQAGNPVVRLTCFVRNAGSAPAGRFSILGLVDGTQPRSPVTRNPMTVATLAPSAQVRHAFDVSAKEFGVSGGQYYAPSPTRHKYTCVADSGNTVRESNEMNNERSQMFNWP